MMHFLPFIFFLLSNAMFCYAQTATDIIKMTEDRMRGKSSEAMIVVKTTRPSWTREMRLKAWMKGNELSMIIVLSPMRDKGIVFLKRKKEVWNWMPSIEKTIKLPPSMMSQSWMGTDFNNDDLVKESSILTDYDHSFLSDTLIDERLCYKINMIPKPASAVVWGKVIICVDKQWLIQLHANFYDENNTLVNTMHSFDVKKMDGRIIPTRFEMVPANKPNQKTEMKYEYIFFDKPMLESFFTTDRMRTLGNIE